jgi:hypothetical protein
MQYTHTVAAGIEIKSQRERQPLTAVAVSVTARDFYYRSHRPFVLDSDLLDVAFERFLVDHAVAAIQISRAVLS